MKIRSEYKLGFWSSILSALFALVWFITYSMRDAIAPMPGWQDLGAYAEAYTPLRLLYVYPSLLLAMSFIVLLASIYRVMEEKDKVWGLIALAIGVVYATMASINYTIQAVAVRMSLAHGEIAGIEMFLPDNPHSIFGALANSYVYMALAMVFLGFAFRGGKLQNWIRWILLLQVITAIGQAGWSFFDLNLGLFIATSMVWVLGAPVVFILLAIWFQKQAA